MVKEIPVNIKWIVQTPLHQSLTAGTYKLWYEEPYWCQAGLRGRILPPSHPSYLKITTMLAGLRRSHFVVADLCLPPSTPVGMSFVLVCLTHTKTSFAWGWISPLLGRASALDCPVSCPALVGLNELGANQLAFLQQVTWRWNTWRSAEGNAPWELS